MGKLTITIETDNDAFQNNDFDYEIERCLRQVASKISVDQDYAGKIIDSNGNNCGTIVHIV